MLGADKALMATAGGAGWQQIDVTSSIDNTTSDIINIICDTNDLMVVVASSRGAVSPTISGGSTAGWTRVLVDNSGNTAADTTQQTSFAMFWARATFSTTHVITVSNLGGNSNVTCGGAYRKEGVTSYAVSASFLETPVTNVGAITMASADVPDATKGQLMVVGVGIANDGITAATVELSAYGAVNNLTSEFRQTSFGADSAAILTAEDLSANVGSGESLTADPDIVSGMQLGVIIFDEA